MTFSEKISLQKYVDSASDQFCKSESNLFNIECSFTTRMKGKTIWGLIGSMIGTICWLAIFGYALIQAKPYINSILFFISAGLLISLIICLLIDEIISFSYYRKISSFKNNITQLRNRIKIGRDAIALNNDEYIKSRLNGWNYPLSIGDSISSEVDVIERTINGMESLEKGFINMMKNILFFTSSVAITVIGSYSLFEMASNIIVQISCKSMESNTLQIFCIIGLIAAVIGEIILSKLLWSNQDCSVTNITLMVVAIGPLLFLALIAAVTLVVVLVIMIVTFVLAILAIVAGFALASASLGGG